jgi:hypothetical protein
MPEEDMLRLEAAEGATRRAQTQERMDAKRLAPRAEVVEAAERVAAHENPLGGKPEGDLPPEPAPDEGQNDERRAGHLREWRHVEGDAEPLGDRGAVALVTIDELDDSGRLAERADPLVETRSVDDVRQPNVFSDPESVRGALQPLSLGMPAESVLELVTESKLHGNTIAVAEQNGTSNAEIADTRALSKIVSP